MTVSVWQEVDSPERAEFDDVVIGAGLVGSYAAKRLVERGRDVALVDARRPAAGASGRNAGFVLTAQREHYTDVIAKQGDAAAKELFELVRANVRRMRELCDEHEIEVGPGPLRLARDAGYADTLEAQARALEADGFDVEFEREDPLGLDHFAYLRFGDDFVTQPARLAEALAENCGATRYDYNEVYAIERGSFSAESAPGVVVRGRRAHLRCERVWICMNGYAGALEPWLGQRVRPTRGQVIVTPKTRPDLLPCACITGFGYFRQLDDGRLLMGGARTLFEAAEYTAADWPTGELHDALLHEVRRLFPDVEARVERFWTGTQGFTADRTAIVGTLPHLPEAAFALGFSGYGNSIGLVAAERMIAMALEGASPGPLDSLRLE